MSFKFIPRRERRSSTPEERDRWIEERREHEKGDRKKVEHHLRRLESEVHDFGQKCNRQ